MPTAAPHVKAEGHQEAASSSGTPHEAATKQDPEHSKAGEPAQTEEIEAEPGQIEEDPEIDLSPDGDLRLGTH